MKLAASEFSTARCSTAGMAETIAAETRARTTVARIFMVVIEILERDIRDESV